MIEKLLERKKIAVKTKITIKTLISTALIAASVISPQLVHLVVGSKGGMLLLPMYLPVIIGGCILGYKWGIMIGVLSPLTSYLLTLGGGVPMPALTRLPFMVVELAVFGLISGLMSSKIAKNPILAFPAVLTTQVVGRLVFILTVAVFSNYTVLNVGLVYEQIITGLVGIVVQAILVPLIIILLSKACKISETNEK